MVVHFLSPEVLYEIAFHLFLSLIYVSNQVIGVLIDEVVEGRSEGVGLFDVKGLEPIVEATAVIVVLLPLASAKSGLLFHEFGN